MRIALCIILIGTVLVGEASAAVLTFDDGASADSNWNTPENWDTDALPGSGDHVYIPSGLTVNIYADTAGLGEIQVDGTVNAISGSLTHKWDKNEVSYNVGPTGLVMVDYGNGGEWLDRHASNEISFASASDGQGGTNYATVKLVLASGTTPNTPIPHNELFDIDAAELIVDVSNLTITPTTVNPIVLFDATNINGTKAFHNVQITGGGGYNVIYDYDNADVLLVVPEPAALALLTLAGLALMRHRNQ